MNVKIKKSKVRNAGKGLFVKADHTFLIGDIICPYEGVLVEYDVAILPTYKSDYMFEVKEGEWVIDAKDIETLGKYANDPIDEDKYNADIMANGNLTALLVASKRINAGQEIYIEYGEFFWHNWDHCDMLSNDHKWDLYDRGSPEFRDWFEENYINE